MGLNFSVPEARSIAQQYYGLDASIQALPSYSDANFAFTEADGRRLVLKIAAGDGASSLIDCQNAALLHLAQRLPGHTTPHVLLTTDGRSVAPFNRDGTTCLVRLVSYLEGVPLAEFVPHSPSLMRQLGELVGSLDAALLDFDHPGAHRSFEWRLEDAMEVLSGSAHYLSDESDREAVERVIDAFQTKVVPHIGDLRCSIIHGDCNDYNVLIDPGKLRAGEAEARIAGVIDFGDLSHSWTIAELAILCAYALMEKPEPLTVLGDLVGGFHKVLPLKPPEMGVLPELIRVRLAVSLVLSARSARQHPDNQYLQVSRQPARRLLHRLDDLDPDALKQAVGRACRRPRRASTSGHESVQDDEEVITTLERRKKRLGPSLSLSYSAPLKIVRGRGQYLFDHLGNRFLDCVNNVSHVGHCHPRVVAAADAQARLLNTNTRYLHDTILDYSERLLKTLPESLSVCYFVCSGSEANELALRLAQTHTQRNAFLVVDGAYHGNTSRLIDLSPYKFEGCGGGGQAEYVFKTPMPDCYRGAFSETDPEAGAGFAAHVLERVAEAAGEGRNIAAFISEALLGCGGQIVPPPGYLRHAFRHVRDAGGVCISDEVQIGLGRVGSKFWGFELQGVVPDIVTMGKPMGNGHPLAAVVTTREIADSFDNGMEYFNTFGGNPVSCAIGLAVLEVVESEALQQHALRVGSELKQGLLDLQKEFPIIGDVRGEGLFLGFELVTDVETLQPAPQHASYLVERMRGLGILLSTDGPLHNVIKIKPPLVFDRYNATLLLDRLAEVLKDTLLFG